MALPTIVVNNSSGSNVTASGAPSGLSAISGTNAAHTNGGASTTITLNNTPDLSGVPTDGSAVLYLATASGRKFSKITAVNDGADTVTVEDSFTIALASAVNYAIGGKRHSFEATNDHTKQLGADAKGGWNIDIEETGTDYVLTSTINLTADGDNANGNINWMSSSATRPTITSSTTGVSLFSMNAASNVKFKHLRLTHGSSGSNKGHGLNYITASSPSNFVEDCVIDACNIGINGTQSSTVISVTETLIQNCFSHGFLMTNTGAAYRSRFLNNGGDGITQTGTSGITVIGCLAADNTGDGIANLISTHGRNNHIQNTTIAFNGSQGFDQGNDNSGGRHVIQNNIFYGNGAFGLRENLGATNSQAICIVNRRNAYGGNSSGDWQNWFNGDEFIDLTADPFVDSGNGDYRLNDAAGGGALCEGLGWSEADVGALGHEESAGGSSGPKRPVAMAGGLV